MFVKFEIIMKIKYMGEPSHGSLRPIIDEVCTENCGEYRSSKFDVLDKSIKLFEVSISGFKFSKRGISCNLLRNSIIAHAFGLFYLSELVPQLLVNSLGLYACL